MEEWLAEKLKNYIMLCIFWLLIVMVGAVILESQDIAIQDYCLNKTGKTNWTAEECNLTAYNSFLKW